MLASALVAFADLGWLTSLVAAGAFFASPLSGVAFPGEDR